MKETQTPTQCNCDLIELRDQLLATKSAAEFVVACAEINTQLKAASWTDIFAQSDFFSDLLNILVENCDANSAAGVLLVLEDLIARYNEEIDSDSLTLIHIALSYHCCKHLLTSNWLQTCSVPSINLPPGDQAGSYFKNCSQVRGKHDKRWDDAAVHASLALSLLPSQETYVTWCLYELIAYGSVTPLPRAVWSVNCTLVDELARLFSIKSTSHWQLICQYVEHHQREFDKCHLSPLVRRAMSTYCVRYIEEAMGLISSAPINTVLEWFSGKVTFEDLVNAGLLNVCHTSGGNLSLAFDNQPSRSPVELLTETGELAQKLHTMHMKSKVPSSL